MMRWGMPPPPRTGGPPVTNMIGERCQDDDQHGREGEGAALFKTGSS
jgi:hypothetical protein